MTSKAVVTSDEGGCRVDHGVARGTFSLDGQTFSVENNIWVIGDDRECVVVDAPHDAQAVAAVVGDRHCRAIVCTHAHDDHVRVAPELSALLDAPVWLHPADRPLWEMTHPGTSWDADLADEQQIEIGGTALHVLHTPGHSPGSVCLYAPDLGGLFSGDTLFNGGPGATGRSFSSREVIERSIRRRLLVLPGPTVVHTGHGEDTTVAAEQQHV